MNSPRSMSRVVISAWWTSSVVSGSGVPSKAVRLMPSREPACSASRTTTCPRVADERSGSAGVSPSIRTYDEVSSTRPYGSLATTNASSASPT